MGKDKVKQVKEINRVFAWKYIEINHRKENYIKNNIIKIKRFELYITAGYRIRIKDKQKT